MNFEKRDSPERRISVMNANRKMLSNDFGKTSTSLSNVVLYSQPSPSPSCRQTNKVSDFFVREKKELSAKWTVI